MKVFGPNIEDEVDNWRKLYKELLHNPRMRWARNVTRMVQKKIHTTFWSEYIEERAGLDDLSVDDGIILMDVKGTELEDVVCSNDQ
jgi:hypothetical protein